MTHDPPLLSTCAELPHAVAATVTPLRLKPADVRMDGNFDVTVEKLIRHWCPTLEEKDLKWVHQLDFGAWTAALCVV